MIKTIKRILPAVVCAGALFYLSACGYLFFTQNKIIFNAGKPLRADYRYSFKTPFEEIWIEADGARLHGLYFKAKAPRPRGLIVFFHGNSERADQFGHSAEEFTGQGYDYFIPDYRGYGKSTGKLTSEKQFLSDAEKILEFVRKLYPDNQIALAGRSLGAVPALYLSTLMQPKITVAIAPFYNIDAMAAIRYPYFPRGLVRYKFPNNEWIPQLKSPVYLIHGTEDRSVPPIQSERLAQLAKAKHERFLVEGAAHSNLQDFPQYHQILASLMKKEDAA